MAAAALGGLVPTLEVEHGDEQFKHKIVKCSCETIEIKGLRQFLGRGSSNPEGSWLCFFQDSVLPVQTSIPISSSQTSTQQTVLLRATLHRQSLGV